MKHFRSKRQKKLFARLVNIWTIYGLLEIEIDTDVKAEMLVLVINEAKEYHFKDGWEDCLTYKQLKEWYLESVSNG